MEASTPKLTVVIPACSVRDSLCSMTAENALIWRDQCDELIISEDGAYCPELHSIADCYILHKRFGVCNNAKLGWVLALASGADYVALMDTDVKLVKGTLREMCVPNRVTVPTITGMQNSFFTAPMLVVPRAISDEHGIYDDAGGMHANESFDAVYYAKVKDIVQLINEVEVSHVRGATRFDQV